MPYGHHCTTCRYCGGPNLHGDCIVIDKPCVNCTMRIEDMEIVAAYVCLGHDCDWQGDEPLKDFIGRQCPKCKRPAAENNSMYRYRNHKNYKRPGGTQ